MNKFFTGLLLALCLTTASAFAQTNFSGNYHLDKDKTEFGQAPTWIVPQELTIHQNGHNLLIVRLLLDPQLKEQRDTLKLSGEGSVFQNFSYSHKTQKFILRWDNDGKGFTITLHSFADDGKPFQNAIEHWMLNADHTLTIDRDVEQVSNNYKYKLTVYYSLQ